MKDKNLPNNYNSLSLEELTDEANKMIEDLISSSESTMSLGHLPLSMRAERVLKNADIDFVSVYFVNAKYECEILFIKQTYCFCLPSL